ncbi:RNA polymerase sigma factor [Aliidiomarina sanyensis]|uniref:Sigma-70 family RNA polymerase sigma factor n=1 Tax=Aliidiomarina sanyensis TaxID=1249555 RepID=A0A432WBQ9_9GAMM|nr:sigma-70 family RNA polymerase sigma factor [Aliidiomarina sanyensis]RUO29486.1 hypothetical protein CWE11_09570 [Aliidiomarina sanyensis]
MLQGAPARDEIIQHYWPRISRAAMGYEHNPTLREELAQEMAFEVWRALATFSNQCALNTYIYRVMHNVGVDHIRRAGRQPITCNEEEPVSLSPCPERVVSDAQNQARLLRAVHRLPLSLRQVVLLKLEDLSNIEIAETLGISESNVGVRLNRGKRQLMELMQGTTP